MNTKHHLRRSVSYYITKKTVVNGQIVNRPSTFRTLQMWQLNFGHVIDLQAYARKHQVPDSYRYGTEVDTVADRAMYYFLKSIVPYTPLYPLDDRAKAMLAAQFNPRGYRHA